MIFIMDKVLFIGIMDIIMKEIYHIINFMEKGLFVGIMVIGLKQNWTIIKKVPLKNFLFYINSKRIYPKKEIIDINKLKAI